MPRRMNILMKTLLLACIAFSQGSDIKVLFNGTELPFPDARPIMQAGRVLVPVRAVLEGMDINVRFDSTTNQIFAEQGDTVVSLRIGKREVNLNGQTVMLDVPALTRDGRAFLPLRFFSEAFGASVKWLPESQTVEIARESPGVSLGWTEALR